MGGRSTLSPSDRCRIAVDLQAHVPTEIVRPQLADGLESLVAAHLVNAEQIAEVCGLAVSVLALQGGRHGKAGIAAPGALPTFPSGFPRASLDTSAAASVTWTSGPLNDPIVWPHGPIATAFSAAPGEQHGFAVDSRFQADRAGGAAEHALRRHGEPHQVVGHREMRRVPQA